MPFAQSEALSLPAAAKRLGVSWPRAWRMVLTGALRAEFVGGRWRVDGADVTRVLEERTRDSGKAGVL